MNRLAESEAFRRRQERRAIANGTHPAIVAQIVARERVQVAEYTSHLREQVTGGVMQFPLDAEVAIGFLSNPFTTSDGIIPELHPFYLREFHKRGRTRDNRTTVVSEEELIHLAFGRLALTSRIPDPSRPGEYIPWSKVIPKTKELEAQYGEGMNGALSSETPMTIKK